MSEKPLVQVDERYEDAPTDAVGFATEHATGDTVALELLAVVASRVGACSNVKRALASVKTTVERLSRADPELESARCAGAVAAERNLRLLLLEHIHDLWICRQVSARTDSNCIRTRDIAHVVVVDDSGSVAETGHVGVVLSLVQSMGR